MLDIQAPKAQDYFEATDKQERSFGRRRRNVNQKIKKRKKKKS
jgi:hypothetical protein